MAYSKLLKEQENLNTKIQNEFKPLFGETNKPMIDGPFDYHSYLDSELTLIFILDEIKQIETNRVFQQEANDIKGALLDKFPFLDLECLNYNFDIFNFLNLTNELINEKHPSLANFTINNIGLILLNKIPNKFSYDNFSDYDPLEIIKEYQNNYLHLYIEQLAFYKPNFVICMAKTFKAISTTFLDYDVSKINYDIKYTPTYFDKNSNCSYIIVSDSMSAFKIMRGYIVDSILKNIEKK